MFPVTASGMTFCKVIIFDEKQQSQKQNQIQILLHVSNIHDLRQRNTVIFSPGNNMSLKGKHSVSVTLLINHFG